MDDKQLDQLKQFKQIIGDVAFNHIVTQWILTLGALCQQMLRYQEASQLKLSQDLEKLAQKQ